MRLCREGRSSFLRHQEFVIRHSSWVPGGGVSKNADVLPHAQRAEPDVKIGEGDPEQAHPGPEHVATVETTDAAIGILAERRPGEPVDATADEVSQGMAAKGVAAQEDDVERENDGAQPEAEAGPAGRGIGKPKGLPNVVRQKDDEEQPDIKEVTVDVLQDERE